MGKNNAKKAFSSITGEKADPVPRYLKLFPSVRCAFEMSIAEIFYLSFMNKLKSFVEWNAFGVCSAIGNRMGIATTKIRQYFMYASILTVGSPIIIYMILAFWRNMRGYIRAAKRNPWYYL